MTIKTLDKKALQSLREPIEAELKALGERLGLSFTLGNGSFGDGAEASFKLVMRVEDAETKAAATKAEWDRNCRYIGIDYSKPEETGLRPEDLGTEFAYGGVTYMTVGIQLKGRGAQKFPIRVACVTDPTKRIKPGDIRLLPETAAPLIRKATDAVATAKAA